MPFEKKQVVEQKKEDEELFYVVNELPKQEVRKMVDEAGKEYAILNYDEALTEILTKIRKIEKILVGK